jgi:hypothetical protein
MRTSSSARLNLRSDDRFGWVWPVEDVRTMSSLACLLILHTPAGVADGVLLCLYAFQSHRLA